MSWCHERGVSWETSGRGRMVLVRITEAGRKAAAAGVEGGRGRRWVGQYQTIARSGRAEGQGD